MSKAPLALVVGVGKPKGEPAPAPAKKAAAKSDDTVERTYFQQAIDAFRNGDDAAAITSAIQGIRSCVQKELDEGY